MDTRTPALPHRIDRDHDDQEMVALIESWRSRGASTSWDEVVGHQNQIRRCQELIEALSRETADLERLHVRIGRGMVIAGGSGTGKTLLARALASAIGRDVIVPPTAELTPSTIARLYAQLARMAPVVVILDEAEGLIGRSYTGEPDVTRALCVALDGIERPDRGPVTLALTTANPHELSPTATRPGRLAPRLDLSPPTRDERLAILERAIAGIPTDGPIDLDRVAERTASWTGAELVIAIEEAVLRSLPDHVDALREDFLLEVVHERYVIEDERPDEPGVALAMAEHEAGHAIYAELMFPGQVAVISVAPSHGSTSLTEEVHRGPLGAETLRRMAGVALAGMAAERVLDPTRGPSEGGHMDRSRATTLLLRWRAVTSPVDVMAFEDGSMSDRGSERMRSAVHAEVEAEAGRLLAEVSAALAPYDVSLRHLARSLLDAQDHVLSGDLLRTALTEAMQLAGTRSRADAGRD